MTPQPVTETYVIQTPSRLTVSPKVSCLGGLSSNWGRNHTVTDFNDQGKMRFPFFIDMKKKQRFSVK